MVGVLCWYDEPADALAAAVAGFARVCDQIVAIDGSYALYPQGRARSLPEQAEAVLASCEAAGAGCLVHRPSEPFYGNEVEKRNLSLRLAATFDPSWVIVFDGDFQMTSCREDSVLHDLTTTGRHVGAYTIRDEHGAQAFRGVYRWTSDLRYERTHYDVRGTYEGETLRLREDATAFNVAIEVAHRPDKRPAARRADWLRYSALRDKLGVETPERIPEMVA